MKYCCTILFAYCLLGSLPAQRVELQVPGHNLFLNSIAAAQQLYPNLNGQNTRISVKEFNFDPNDVDLLGRVGPSPTAAAFSDIHAGLMASLIAGAGNADANGRGVAPGAQIISSSFVGLQPDNNYSNPLIHVQNHSYGIKIDNFYSKTAQAYDLSCLTNPLLVQVFSAGNRGDSLSPTGIYAGIPTFANLTGHFKMAKNVLLVGAVDSFGQVSPLSSRGPTYDGRLKPDLVAFGQDGTSGAAALVSGSSAVLQQALSQQNGQMPPSELTRAILLNSADDILAPGPDFTSGFGNLNLKKAIEIVQKNNFFLGQLSQNQTISLPLVLPAQIHTLKLTLCWNDPAAAENAAKALINDLDLVLKAPNGAMYLPWVLNTMPNSDALHSLAQRAPDTLNNTEQITVDFPAAGNWTIEISGKLKSNAVQSFALSWDWDTIGHFSWIFPLKNAPAPAGKDVILQWESKLGGASLEIEYQNLAENQWKPISIVDGTQQQLRWNLPDTNMLVQVKARNGTHSWLSDTFYISNKPAIKIGFNCADSLLLFWEKTGENDRYQLSGLGEKYLEPIQVLQDTFIVLYKNTFPQIRYAIAPMAPNQDIFGPRSAAPDIRTQGVDCYFSQFLASLNPDQTNIDLQLVLGSTYSIRTIVFEKWRQQQYLPVATFTANQLNYTTSDISATAGRNIYRARLITNSGQFLLSDPMEVFVPGVAGVRVFPSPVPANGTLQVVAQIGDESDEFFLYDLNGRLLWQQTLTETHTNIELNQMPTGLYYWMLKGKSSGKILVK